MVVEIVVSWMPLELGGPLTYTTFRERVSEGVTYERILEIVSEFVQDLRSKYASVIGAVQVRLI